MAQVTRVLTLLGILGLPVHVFALLVVHPEQPILAYAIFLFIVLGLWQLVYSIVFGLVTYKLSSIKLRIQDCLIVAGNLMMFLTLSVIFPRSFQNVYLFSVLMILSIPYLTYITTVYTNTDLRTATLSVALTNTIFIVLALLLHAVSLMLSVV